MERERYPSVAVADRALDTTHSGLIDLAELCRATEALGQEFAPAGRSCLEPFQIRADHLFVVVRQEVDLIERARVDCLCDGADADRLALGGGPQVRPSHPRDEESSHDTGIQETLFTN